MFFFVLIAGVLLAGAAYQWIGTQLDLRRFPPPGRFVEIDGTRLHLHQQGYGTPVVILEAGIAGSSLGWALVQPAIAEFTTVCSYDRAGLGWSGPSPKSKTLDQMSSQLEALLIKAQLEPPYVLVGHSFGGLLIRAYAHLRPRNVVGMVFVDPVSLSVWADCGTRERRRLATGVKLSRRGAILARLGIVRLALALLVSGGRLLPKLIGRAAARQGAGTMERLVGEVRKLPSDLWPVVQSHWCNPKNFSAMAAYLASLPECAVQAQRMDIPAHVPFLVLSAGNSSAGELSERASWVRQSQAGRHEQAPGTGHWIQLERPDLVIDAVRDMVDRFRCDHPVQLR